MTVNDSRPDTPPRRSAGPLQIAAAVFWGFFGVRKQRKLEQDVASIKPHHIVIAGVTPEQPMSVTKGCWLSSSAGIGNPLDSMSVQKP